MGLRAVLIAPGHIHKPVMDGAYHPVLLTGDFQA